MERLCVISLALASSLVPFTWADEARIPIFQPATIAQPGHYVLTRDIAIASGHAITVKANEVVLDLNGRTLRSSSAVAGDNLIEIVDGYTNVTIRHGRLFGGSVGINYSSTTSATRLHFEDVEISGTASHGILVGGAGHVEAISCRIFDSGGNGIFIGGLSPATFGGEFIDNVIQGSAAYGLVVIGLKAGTVRGNEISNYGLTMSSVEGLRLQGSAGGSQGGNLVEGNTVRGSDDDFGIVIDAKTPNNLIVNNVATGNGNIGIVVESAGNRLAMNVASGNAVGIAIAGGQNILERNHAANNTGDGVRAYGNYNLVDSNIIVGNGGYGLSFWNTTTASVGGAYRDNMLRGNTSGAVYVDPGASATDAGGNIL